MLTHIYIDRLSYNEKDNLNSMIGLASTSGMLLTQHQELVLRIGRQLDRDITDMTREQRWHRIIAHGVEISRYSEEEDMELIREEILHDIGIIQIA